jgi:hypothetical protein
MFQLNDEVLVARFARTAKPSPEQDIRVQESPGPQALQRHGHPGNLVAGAALAPRLQATIMRPAATPFLPIRPARAHLVMSHYIRLVRFSF